MGTRTTRGWPWQQDRELVRYNWIAVTIVGLMLAVQGVALQFTRIDWLPTPPRQAGDPTIGLAFAGVFVVESLAIVAVYVAYKRLPEWLRAYLKQGVQWAVILGCTLIIIGVLGVLAQAGEVRVIARALVAMTGWAGVCYMFYRFDQYGWVLHNSIAFTAAAGGVFVFAMLLEPHVIVLLQLFLLAWDYVAVELSDIMDWLVEFSTAARVPNYFVIPSGLRLPWDALGSLEELADDDRVATVIGVGDFVIPGALPLSIAVQSGGWGIVSAASLAGIIVSVGALVAYYSDSDSGAPGLPWLNTGAISGYALGLIVVGLPI